MWWGCARGPFPLLLQHSHQTEAARAPGLQGHQGCSSLSLMAGISAAQVPCDSPVPA